MNCQETQSYQADRQSKICEQLVLPETGVVVVGHGTADPVGAAETADIVVQVNAILPNIPVELGYLEVIEPTISMAVDRLAARGCISRVRRGGRQRGSRNHRAFRRHRLRVRLRGSIRLRRVAGSCRRRRKGRARFPV